MQGYLPRDLYELNCKYGSESELRDLIALFHEHRIKVIADIVVNHRCASFQVRRITVTRHACSRAAREKRQRSNVCSRAVRTWLASLMTRL